MEFLLLLLLLLSLSHFSMSLSHSVQSFCSKSSFFSVSFSIMLAEHCKNSIQLQKARDISFFSRCIIVVAAFSHFWQHFLMQQMLNMNSCYNFSLHIDRQRNELMQAMRYNGQCSNQLPVFLFAQFLLYECVWNSLFLYGFMCICFRMAFFSHVNKYTE